MNDGMKDNLKKMLDEKVRGLRLSLDNWYDLMIKLQNSLDVGNGDFNSMIDTDYLKEVAIGY